MPKVDLVPLARTDYQKLEEGDIVYDRYGNRHKVIAIKYSKSNPKNRELSLKHGLRDYGKIKINETGWVGHATGQGLFKERGQKYATARSPKRGVSRGSRVIAVVPLSQGDRKVKAGTRGTVKDIRRLTLAQSKQFHRDHKALISVKWDRGGTFDNVYPTQIKPA